MATPVSDRPDADPAIPFSGERSNPAHTDSLPDPARAFWLWFGYVFIAASFLLRLAYLASGRIELSGDEAYQWQWSKHLALSYYSKPPLIACAQWLGTALWGDTAFGVRFFAPVIAAMVAWLFFRFLARQIGTRWGFLFLVMLTFVPLVAIGATLMTIDSLSVLFWTAALVSGWKAVERDSTAAWLWTGLWIGLGFLSKYTAPFHLFCWALFFVCRPQARRRLRRPGPYAALAIVALCAMPVVLWNSQHGWITVRHLENRGGLDRAWHPGLRFVWDFLVQETLLLNPFFVLAAIWGIVAGSVRFLRQGSARETNQPFPVYLACMGAPVFLFYLVWSLRARVQPNWIAPSILPLFALALWCWQRSGGKGQRRLLEACGGLGLIFGLGVIAFLHESNLVEKITGRPLPEGKDPLVRVRGWSQTAQLVDEVRGELLREGKPVFIIGDHYGIASLISFYLPEAKAGVPDHPLVFVESSSEPHNQYYFWEGYTSRKGQNAIYIEETDGPRTIPKNLLAEFRSVTDLGLHTVSADGRVLHQFQLFACRDLR